MPRALRVAIPYTYDGRIRKRIPEEKMATPEKPRPAKKPAPPVTVKDPEFIDGVLEGGRKVTVVGVGPNPERKGTSIVAGGAAAKKTGASKPVAVRIDRNTTLIKRTGESLPPASAVELREGGVIVVEGKQNKRGVIRAKRVVVGADHVVPCSRFLRAGWSFLIFWARATVAFRFRSSGQG